MADDHLDPNEISRAEFDLARRGYEQNAVRGFLHQVSRTVAAIQRELRDLRERAERAETRADLAERFDEARMIQLLGEETTRVLTSAKEAATEIRAKAEESAARLISEAQTDAATRRADLEAELGRRRAAVEADAEQVLERALTELDRRTSEAEAAAQRILEEAEERARGLRDEARAELEHARDEAEQIRESARAEGKEMLAEAQALRERVLRDLSARRRKAREQVEKLNAGRERLLQAYEVVRRTLDEANAELLVSVGEARVAGDAAARRIADEPDTTVEQLEAELDAVRAVDLPLLEQPGEGAGDAGAERDGGAAADDAGGDAANDADAQGVAAEPELAAGAEDAEPEAAAADEEDDEDGEDGEDGEPEVAPVQEAAGAEAEVAGSADRGGAGSTVDDLFARIREESEPPGEPPAEPSGDDEAASAAGSDAAPAAAPAGVDAAGAEHDRAEDGPDPVVHDRSADGPDPVVEAEHEPAADEEGAAALARRDAALEPIEREITKRLKRVLADEQNEVLDLLRRSRPPDADSLLPPPTDHVQRWAEAAAAPLDDAATAGADALGSRTPGPVQAPQALSYELAHAIIDPLRERVARVFAAVDGDHDEIGSRLRALYREWKGQRLAEAARHELVAAYTSGLYASLPESCALRWVVDRSGEPCPDADDNALAGAVTRGEPFPTGDAMPPAHPGCRCLVLRAER